MRKRALLAVLAIVACSSASAPRSAGAPRTYRMGFSATPPRLTIEDVLATIDSASKHSDAALLAVTVPWQQLLADTGAAFLVRREVYPLASLWKQRGFPVVMMIDPANGLARDKEAPGLDSLGRSISEPAVQAKYAEFVTALDSIIRPDWLGTAMETNLIRAVAPESVYTGVRSAANLAVAQMRAAGSTTRMFVSVQVDVAWGRPPFTTGFVGIARDRTDFPFVQMIGLSSYPYLSGFTRPEDIPLDYYKRLMPDGALPMMVVEGGWTSASLDPIVSSPALQARYIKRQMQLADEAALLGVLQITFTDLDLSAWSLPPGSILPLFAHLGMVDSVFRAKPSLAEWDRTLARPFTP